MGGKCACRSVMGTEDAFLSNSGSVRFSVYSIVLVYEPSHFWKFVYGYCFLSRIGLSGS